VLQRADFVDFFSNYASISGVEWEKLVMQKKFLAVALLAFTAPAQAEELVVDGSTRLPVAYEELRNGQPDRAVALLTSSTEVALRDPSRLINLGTAYARLGRTSEALAMYRAATATPIRYDLELADGRYMDSRWAARLALVGLEKKGRVTVALADAR
jgi:tetratricopeptide (TPR) repeat protein